MVKELQNCTNVYQQNPRGINMELNYEGTTLEMEEKNFSQVKNDYIGALIRESAFNVLSHAVGRVLIILSFCRLKIGFTSHLG